MALPDALPPKPGARKITLAGDRKLHDSPRQVGALRHLTRLVVRILVRRTDPGTVTPDANDYATGTVQVVAGGADHELTKATAGR